MVLEEPRYSHSRGTRNERTVAVEDIINFFSATDNIGTGGQPTPGQLADVAEAGYTTVINLAMHDSDNALRDKGSIVSSLGMDYVHIPVPFEATSPVLRYWQPNMEPAWRSIMELGAGDLEIGDGGHDA